MTAVPLGRLGLFEAPEHPADQPRLRVDPAWSPARLSLEILRSGWPWVLPASVLLMLSSTAGMLLPVVVGSVVDRAAIPAEHGEGALWRSAVPSALALIGLYAVLAAAYRFGSRLGWFAVQRAHFELSDAVISRALDPRGRDGPARPPGALLSLATSDVLAACRVLFVAVYPPGEILGLIVAAVVLITIHPALGLMCALGLPVLLLALRRASRPLEQRSEQEQAGLARAAASAADLIQGHRILAGLHAQRRAAGSYAGVSRAAMRSALSARSAEAAFDGLSAAASQLFAAAVTALAAALALRGSISAGQLVTVSGLALMLVGPIQTVLDALGSFWAVGQASSRRILTMLAEPPSPAALGTVEPTRAAAGRAESPLAFDHVGLPGQTELDARLPARGLVVLDLPQRSRAPLARALSLQALPSSGRILWDGTPLEDCEPAALRRLLLVCPHVPGVLSGSVLDNVRPPGPAPDDDGETDEATCREALRAACLLEGELAHGYGTQVGDGGSQLSGGQRQRLALARALAADPPVLVLSDPTTSVDPVTQQRIVAAIQRIRSARLTLVLTDSPAFRAGADRILTARAASSGSRSDRHD